MSNLPTEERNVGAQAANEPNPRFATNIVMETTSTFRVFNIRRYEVLVRLSSLSLLGFEESLNLENQRPNAIGMPAKPRI